MDINKTMKAMVTYYDAEVLAKMFRTGSIVGASIDEETGCLEFKIMVGERRSEYLLMDEKEMKIMLEAMLERTALKNCKGQFIPVAEVEVEKLNDMSMESYEVVARIQFHECDGYEKRFLMGCDDKEKVAELVDQCAQDMFADAESAEISVTDGEIQVTVAELLLEYKEILLPGEVEVPDWMGNYPLEGGENIFKWKLDSLLNKYFPAYCHDVDVIITRDFRYPCDETYDIRVMVDQETMITAKVEEL